jgi:putative hemolysin
MLPRTEVSFLEAATTIEDAVAVVAQQPHSRYPVIRDSSDDVVGFVHVRDLLSVPDRSRRVSTLVRPITSFPGTNEVLVTLAEMRRTRQHLAIVQDEYGGTAGIVTLEDLVEELIGDVTDEYDVVRIQESPSTPGEVVMDGLVNLEDFEEVTGFALPEGPYETVAGFVVALLGRVPQVDDVVQADGHEFHVVELDGRRVSRVAVRVTAPADPTPS